ncbi:MAG: ParB N-terminal domain-containing protein, partial [Candidatus Thorarchaeota archaeon]
MGATMMQEETPAIVMIRIDRLRTGDSNVRQRVGQIDDLVNSIRQVGILEPLIVRPVG